MRTATGQIQTADGPCDCFLAEPGDGKQHPGVVLFMDAFGLRPSLEEMSKTLAARGFVVLTPNLFYRLRPAPVFNLKFPLRAEDMPEARGQVIPVAREYDTEAGLRDTKCFLDFLAQHPAVSGGRFGVTGYCMGGAMALRAAGRFPDRIAAAGCFHGGNLATDAETSPHRFLKTAQAKLYLGNAENDASLPPEQIERLEKVLAESGLAYTMETYSAAHGYTQKDLPAYNEAALARHWRALDQLFSVLR